MGLDSYSCSCYTKDMKKIRVFLDGDGWMTETNDADVIAVFGTGILPTPFLKGTKASDVLSVLRQLNPDAEIILKES